MAKLTVNTKALESMLFIWASLADREKLPDAFFIELSESPEMAAAYDENFDANGFRKVLSALANRELLNGATQREKRFWNNNMWMTEDLEFTNMMVEPLKTLNLDERAAEICKVAGSDECEVIFYPGCDEFATRKGNKLYINFFKVQLDIMNPDAPPTLEGQSIPDYIEARFKA